MADELIDETYYAVGPNGDVGEVAYKRRHSTLRTRVVTELLKDDWSIAHKSGEITEVWCKVDEGQMVAARERFKVWASSQHEAPKEKATSVYRLVVNLSTVFGHMRAYTDSFSSTDDMRTVAKTYSQTPGLYDVETWDDDKGIWISSEETMLGDTNAYARGLEKAADIVRSYRTSNDPMHVESILRERANHIRDGRATS